MLHYNFPPFSVGEVASCAEPDGAKSATARWPSARFRLCCRPKEKFPYTMRVVSDILESNGSTSMATVCGASLSLMDAGVPMKPLRSRGVAMGLGEGRRRSTPS